MGNAASVDPADVIEETSETQVKYLNKQKTILIRSETDRVKRSLTLRANLQATLKGNVNVRDAVKVPVGEDEDEWIAMNTFMFYQVATNVHNMCSEFCTKESCPQMTAGSKFTYQWADGKKVKKGIAVSAPEYIEYLFDWVYETISDPQIFPQDDDTKFPKTFRKIVANIYKRLFRLYAHIFHSHFDDFRNNGSEAHLNSSFKHFALFILQFDIVDQKDLMPLENLIQMLLTK